jgi:hypothetical protein
MDHRTQLPEFGILRLEELPIHVYLTNNTAKIAKITESPYYLSLNENNPAIFLAYQETMRGLPTARSEISWDQFLDLTSDIADNGLQNTGAPIRFGDFGQIDGHHRLAILCDLYGPQAKVLISSGVATFPAPDLEVVAAVADETVPKEMSPPRYQPGLWFTRAQAAPKPRNFAEKTAAMPRRPRRDCGRRAWRDRAPGRRA